VAIVGGGFVGAEVAAEARRRGLEVLIEAEAAPLSRALGERIGALCGRLHIRSGVSVRCGVSVTGFDGAGSVERVRLSDGTSLAAELVVVGICAVPAVGWLRSSGIALDNSVVCDSYCRASAPGVYAAEDVARWWHPGYGEHVRVEHWTNTREQGSAVATNLLSPESPKEYATHPLRLVRSVRQPDPTGGSPRVRRSPDRPRR
jgi:NADPH-dependent 2,4-dienoyl-CoA reductase/sulfur reductase-like enzyme